MEHNEEPRFLQEGLRPIVQGVIAIYNVYEDISDYFDGIVDQIENIVDKIREEFKPLDILIIFTEMNLANYEVYRSLTQVFSFIEVFMRAIVSAYSKINAFLSSINLPPIDLGLDDLDIDWNNVCFSNVLNKFLCA